MNGRIKSIDAIKGLAILGVILIHTTTRTLEASNFNLINFSWTLFLNQAMRFAVPLFMIISGFVLEVGRREESYWSFIKRRFSKIFIPYVIWSLIYYLFIYNNNDDKLTEVLLTGNASYQLYFIPALLVFYLSFPLARKLVHKFSNKIILVPITFIGLILLYKNYYIKAFDLGDEINAMILSYNYFVIGIIAAKNKMIIDRVTNKFKLFLSIPTASLALYVFWEGRSRYLLTGNYLSYYSQWRPSVFFYTIFTALLFYYIFEHTKLNGSFIPLREDLGRKPMGERSVFASEGFCSRRSLGEDTATVKSGIFISRFAKHSFFVFFVHVAVLEIVWKLFGQNAFSITGGVIGKIVFDPVFFVGVTLISFLLAKLLHRIPKLIRLFG